MKHLRRNLLLFVASIVLGSSLMSYEAYAQNQNTVQPVQQLAVFDSTGMRVGNVLQLDAISRQDFHPVAVVAFTFDGRLIVATVSREFLEGPGPLGGPIFFESTNCSGTSFAARFGEAGWVGVDLELLGRNSIFPISWILFNRVYVPDGPARAISVKSVQIGIFLSGDPLCIPLEQEAFSTPLKFLVDLGTRFQPPFTVR